MFGRSDDDSEAHPLGKVSKMSDVLPGVRLSSDDAAWLGTYGIKASPQGEKTARQGIQWKPVLQCVGGFLVLVAIVVVYTWAAPGWWAAY